MMEEGPLNVWREPPLFVRRVVEALYVEAMVLADEAASGFAEARDRARGEPDALLRISLSCEALKTTTRLMHVLAWLLHQRALAAGDIRPGGGGVLGRADAADAAVCGKFPDTLRAIITASERIYARVAALDARLARQRDGQAAVDAPVARLMGTLNQHFASD